MRVDASLLLSSGHPHAKRYPLSTLWYEAQLVRERVNGLVATEAVMMDAVITSVLSPKNGRQHLDKLLRKLNSGH